MDTTLLFLVFLAASALILGLSIPLALGKVAPNRLYGFRTPQTLDNPNVWYPANRVTGAWGIATGIVTACATVACHFAEVPLPASALVPVGTLVAGALAMIVHGMIVAGRAA